MIGTVTLDTTVECNPTPDSSISALVCYTDGIVYTNHPNTNDCSAEPRDNCIPIGDCHHFPGTLPNLIETER